VLRLRLPKASSGARQRIPVQTRRTPPDSNQADSAKTDSAQAGSAQTGPAGASKK
jgi:hypothetical protein